MPIEVPFLFAKEDKYPFNLVGLLDLHGVLLLVLGCNEILGGTKSLSEESPDPMSPENLGGYLSGVNLNILEHPEHLAYGGYNDGSSST